MKRLSPALLVLFCIFFADNNSFAADYHVIINSQQQGPISMDQLRQMTNDGSITKNTLVWKNGMAAWEKAGAQQELQGVFTVAVPPPPPSVSVPPPPPLPPAQSVAEQASLPNTTAVDPQEAIDPDAVTDLQKEPDFISSSEQIRDTIEQFASSRDIEFGVENAKGQRFYSATETVSVDETNPQWPKWRVVAYKKAFLKIQQTFLESEYGNIAGDTLQDYFSDDSDNRLDFPKSDDPRAASKLGEIWDKLAALTGAKLDEALAELGVDPSEFNAAPLEQRKELFKNNFIEKSVTKAAGGLNGLIPIKTFEGVDSKGNHTIGVIGMYYGKMKQLADDIVRKRTPMLTKKSGKPVKTYIPENKKVLADTFGIRVVFDEQGDPAIVSYGQWSYVYKGASEKKRVRGYDHALKKANTESQKQIANFLSSTAEYKQIEETNANEEEVAILDRDGNLGQKEITEMIDKIKSTMKVKFKADLRGMKKARQWSYKNENGHEIVGVVTVWSQKNADSTDRVRNWKSNHKSKAHAKAPAKLPSQRESEVSEGAGMDLDF